MKLVQFNAKNVANTQVQSQQFLLLFFASELAKMTLDSTRRSSDNYSRREKKKKTMPGNNIQQ